MSTKCSVVYKGLGEGLPVKGIAQGLVSVDRGQEQDTSDKCPPRYPRYLERCGRICWKHALFWEEPGATFRTTMMPAFRKLNLTW